MTTTTTTILSRRRNGSETQKGKEEESVEIHVGDTRANHGGCAYLPLRNYSRTVYFTVTVLFISYEYLDDGSILCIRVLHPFYVYPLFLFFPSPTEGIYNLVFNFNCK